MSKVASLAVRVRSLYRASSGVTRGPGGRVEAVASAPFISRTDGRPLSLAAHSDKSAPEAGPYGPNVPYTEVMGSLA